MSYCVYGDIQARNPYRSITASTKPSITDVNAWIVEAEAEINGYLAAMDFESPCTNSTGKSILKNKVVTYVSGLLKKAYASAGGDGSNDDGKDDIDMWNLFLDDLDKAPDKWGRIFQAGSKVGASTSRIRSYATCNNDNKSIANGDFDPEFTKGSIF
jgi:hypothetical protein